MPGNFRNGDVEQILRLADEPALLAEAAQRRLGAVLAAKDVQLSTVASMRRCTVPRAAPTPGSTASSSTIPAPPAQMLVCVRKAEIGALCQVRLAVGVLIRAPRISRRVPLPQSEI